MDCFKKACYEEATDLLSKAIAQEKGEKGFYINRGDCFFKLGDFDFAMADYEQALELDEQDQSVRTRMAAIHYELGLQHYQERNLVVRNLPVVLLLTTIKTPHMRTAVTSQRCAPAVSGGRVVVDTSYWLQSDSRPILHHPMQNTAGKCVSKSMSTH